MKTVTNMQTAVIAIVVELIIFTIWYVTKNGDGTVGGAIGSLTPLIPGATLAPFTNYPGKTLLYLRTPTLTSRLAQPGMSSSDGNYVYLGKFPNVGGCADANSDSPAYTYFSPQDNTYGGMCYRVNKPEMTNLHGVGYSHSGIRP